MRLMPGITLSWRSMIWFISYLILAKSDVFSLAPTCMLLIYKDTWLTLISVGRRWPVKWNEINFLVGWPVCSAEAEPAEPPASVSHVTCDNLHCPWHSDSDTVTDITHSVSIHWSMANRRTRSSKIQKIDEDSDFDLDFDQDFGPSPESVPSEGEQQRKYGAFWLCIRVHNQSYADNLFFQIRLIAALKGELIK